MNELETAILEITKDGFPLLTVYSVCRKLKIPQESSRNASYVRVYRALEKLIVCQHMVVARGIRDPSVYFNVHRLTPTDIS